MSKRNAIFAVSVAALLGVGAVGAIAEDDDSNPPSDNVAMVTAVEPEAAEAVSALADDRTSTDEMPAQVAGDIGERADFGMNPDLARRSVANTANSVYVVPARERVCTVLTIGQGATAICPETEKLADGRGDAGTAVLPTGDIAVFGVVPDGVASVTVEIGTATSRAVEVVDNAFYTVVEAGIALRSVLHDGPDGAVEIPIFDPTAP